MDEDVAPEEIRQRFSIVRFAIVSGAAAGFLWLCFASWSVNTYGNVTDGIRAVSGERLSVAPPIADLGLIDSRQEISADFILKNLSSRQITVYGATFDCDCVSMSGVPVTLARRGRRTVTVSIAKGDLSPGEEFVHQAVLNLDVDHPPIVLTVRGTAK